MKKRKIILMGALVVLAVLGITACSKSSSTETTTVYGQVTAVSGSSVTLALGAVSQTTTASGSATSATTGSAMSAPSGTKPAGDPPSGTKPAGNPPSGAGQGSSSITLSGETQTITISDASIVKSSSTVSGQAVSTSTSTSATSNITVGTILKVTYKSSFDNLTAIEIVSSGQQGGTGGSSSVDTGTGAYTVEDDSTSSDTYNSTKADENAVRSEGTTTASLKNATVNKSAGAASSSDASSFYGLNSAILALDSSVLNITGGTVTASAEGANGVFAYDGATINITDTKVNVTGGNAGGIEVAGGATMNATNLTVFSKVKAAIRSDRGGGTMNVNGGTYTTSGSTGAPAVYSTAKVNVKNATLTANTSEAIVVEGLNSVSLTNCKVTGNMKGTYGSSGKNIHNVMLYQSMSGDAEEGNSSFTMKSGSLTSKNGDMFYVTNTSSTISLNDVKMKLAEGTNLLVVSGNDGSNGWGTAGSNGGTCEFKVSNQTLSGSIVVDKISKLTMNITKNSTYTGEINSDKTTAASLSVTVDSTSKWTLTADSYITEFNGSMDNVDTNGHTLYVNGVAQN